MSAQPPTPARSQASLRWIGGANVPTLGGYRVNAGIPFAELRVEAGELQLSLRGPLSRLAHAEILRAKPRDLEVIFPIRSKARFRGVGFRRADGREYYFKTTRIDEVLGVLGGLGFPVTTEAGKATKIWRGDP